MANKSINNISDIVMPISSIAMSLKVNQRTLRIWDAEGILSPKRTEKNRRYYGLDDLEKGKVILFLTRNLALNLSGVKIILTILEKQNLKPDKYMSYIQNIAKNANITTKDQKNNIQKTTRKGRPASKGALK